MRKLQVQTNWIRTVRFEVRGLRAFLKALVSTALLCLSVSYAFGQPEVKNVLIFFHVPEPVRDPPYVDRIESVLRSRVPFPVDFYIEYMDVRQSGEKDYLQNRAKSLRDTYSGRKLDLVMLSGYPALDLVLKHRSELFSGVPIEYFSVESREIAGRSWLGITGWLRLRTFLRICREIFRYVFFA